MADKADSVIPGSGTDLVSFMDIADNRLEYSAWLRMPITKAVLRLVEDSIRPVSKPESMNSDRYSGLMDGRYEVLRLLGCLDKIYEVSKAVRTELPTETYGVETVLQTQFGYTPERARELAGRSQASLHEGDAE